MEAVGNCNLKAGEEEAGGFPELTGQKAKPVGSTPDHDFKTKAR